MTSDAFEAYQQFLALHSHFYQKNYDYFKYNKKIRASYERFLNRKDKYFFRKLAKEKDIEGFVVSNILASTKKIWIMDLFDEKAEENYIDWKKQKESLFYNFKEDLSILHNDVSMSILVKNGQHPLLLKQYLSKSISINTLIILDSCLHIFDYWNTHIQDNVVWPGEYMKLVKYRSFLSFDKAKYKNYLVDIIKKK